MKKFSSRKKNEKNKVSVVIETDEANVEKFQKEARKAIRKMNRLVGGKLSFQVVITNPDSKNQEG